MGEKEIQKWVSLISLTGIASDKPDELVINSLARGKSCELIAPHVGMLSRAPDLFLMGLFSMLDGLIDRPLQKVLNDLPLTEDLKDALLGKPGHPRKVLDLVLAQEMGGGFLATLLTVYDCRKTPCRISTSNRFNGPGRHLTRNNFNVLINTEITGNSRFRTDTNQHPNEPVS